MTFFTQFVQRATRWPMGWPIALCGWVITAPTGVARALLYLLIDYSRHSTTLFIMPIRISVRKHKGWKSRRVRGVIEDKEDGGASLLLHHIIDFAPASTQPVLSCTFPHWPTHWEWGQVCTSPSSRSRDLASIPTFAGKLLITPDLATACLARPITWWKLY